MGTESDTRGVSVPQRLSEYAGLYFRVYVSVHLLRRKSSTCW